MEEALLSFIEENHFNRRVYNQDKSPNHSVFQTKEWLMEAVVSVMDWPARL